MPKCSMKSVFNELFEDVDIEEDLSKEEIQILEERLNVIKKIQNLEFL